MMQPMPIHLANFFFYTNALICLILGVLAFMALHQGRIHGLSKVGQFGVKSFCICAVLGSVGATLSAFMQPLHLWSQVATDFGINASLILILFGHIHRRSDNG